MTMLSIGDPNEPENEARSSRSIVSTVLKKLRSHVCGTWKSITKLGKDDPRRVIHSLKVGLALTLVSLLYYFQPLYDSFGVSAMWAVITVVVVFEFYVGATLGKGLNRTVATLLGGVLGVGAHLLASLCSKTGGEPIVIGLLVFLQAVICTYLRFFPKIKARYDYGLLVFMLTFCMISITGVRQNEIMKLAHKRLATILIGGLASLLVSILVCPVWAGHDLHNLVTRNIEIIANVLEGFGTNDHRCSSLLMQGYRSVLNSKGNEETLANFALWEPPHGKFKLHHPWKHYLKLGALARKCSYRIDALNTYVNSHVQIEELGNAFLECSNALKLIASAMKSMSGPRLGSIRTHIARSRGAMDKIKSWVDPMNTTHRDEVMEFVPVAIVVVLLRDIVKCTEEMVEVANELAALARFEVAIESSSDCEPACETKSIDCPDHVVIALFSTDHESNGDGDLSDFDLEVNAENVEV